MIVSFFKSGKSGSSGPRNYLLGDKTADGRIRDPKPEVFMGDVEATSKGIDGNRRELKYTSGVIAFRKNEKLTDDQLKDVCKDFLKTMAPGLEPGQNFNSYFVRHEHEGNTELHFIIERRENTTGKSFNVCPPGRKTQQYIRDFQALTNHKYGFNQVVEDQMKDGASTDIFFNLDKNAPFKKNADLLVQKLEQLVQAGKIKDRDHLLTTLEDKGFEITRKGQDYVSVKFPNQFKYEKAVRLKNPIFKENSDYKQLVDLSKTEQPKQLTEAKFDEIKERFESVFEERKTFNQKQFSSKFKREYSFEGSARQPKKFYNPSTSISQNHFKHTSSKFPKILKIGKSGKLFSNQRPVNFDYNKQVLDHRPQEPKIIHNIEPQKIQEIAPAKSSVLQNLEKSRQEQGSPETGPKHTSGGAVALGSSIASLESQILSLVQQATYTKDPQQKAMLMHKAYALRVQKEKLEAQLAEEKKAALNRPRLG